MDKFQNTLYTNDNLYILNGMNSESIDLIYLDPPFNSKRTYSAPIGSKSAGASFKDMWSWEDVNEFYLEKMFTDYPFLVSFIQAIEGIHGKAMMSYITYMTQRIIEMHRILKLTGSLYLHCDPTASHYLKIVLDRIFGKDNFRNEIVWKRTYAHNDPKQFGRNRDTIFFYTKSKKYTYNKIYTDYTEEYKSNFFKFKDTKGIYRLVTLTGPKTNPNDKEWKGWHPASSGRSWSVPKRIVNKLVSEEKAKTMSVNARLNLLYDNNYIVFSKNGVPSFKSYLKDLPGTPAQEIWTDINPISSHSKERTGYPTQKPLALMHRIIKASSNEGDVVLDPFCGCATTCVASQQLNRQWIGIDIEAQAASVLITRLSDDAGLFEDFINRLDIPQRTDIQIIAPTINIKNRLFKEQKEKCNACDNQMRIIDLEIDHIIPKSKGGGNYYENYQLLCGSCNRTKGNRPMEYLIDKIRKRESLMKSKLTFGLKV